MAPQFNFSRGSSLDDTAFASCRPGRQTNKTEAKGAVKPEEVKEWVDFMKGNNIKRVLSLLGDDEVQWYAEDLDAAMREAFGKDRYHRTSVHSEDALSIMHMAFTAAYDSKEKIVVHCSGGSGRAPLGLGVALHLRHSKSPKEACEEIVREAEGMDGVKRRPNEAKLVVLLEQGSLPRKAS